MTVLDNWSMAVACALGLSLLSSCGTDGNAGPEVQFLAPTDGAMLGEASTVRIDVLVGDDRDSIEDLSLVWVLPDAVAEPPTPDSAGTLSFVVSDLQIGTYPFSLTATDSAGLTGTAVLFFQVGKDSDRDGYVDVGAGGSDCDDDDPLIHPDALEICDNIDNDCDLLIDDQDVDVGGTTTFFADSDRDGFGDPSDSTEACVRPQGYLLDDTDCDDSHAGSFPDAPEVCDGKDNDCDDLIDSDDDDWVVDSGTTYFQDADGDEFGDAMVRVVACDAPEYFVLDGEDCDDTNVDVNPSATEVCDTIDNDCDEAVDDADPDLDTSSGSTFYLDVDGDGFGDPMSSVATCKAPERYVADDSDCDDTSGRINPDATEICDAVDNDCDGDVDDDDAAVDMTTATTFYLDDDGDAYGLKSKPSLACDLPSGYAADMGDCDDSNKAINPGATEVCDDVDNDCDGKVDDADTSLDKSSGSKWYADVDGDLFGDKDDRVEACDAPKGYVADDTDCADDAKEVNPKATEVCDSVDNDCDGDVDDDDASVDLTTGVTYYRDKDGDLYGDAKSSKRACSQPTAHVKDNTDCDDANKAVNPGAAEVCDTIDNDCDGAADDADDDTVLKMWYADDDGDTYGNPDVVKKLCATPSGYVANSLDCDDVKKTVSPKAIEVCDAIDNDCDGKIDDADTSLDAATTTFWYRDGDGDTYGDPAVSRKACAAPKGYVVNKSDCDDTKGAIHPKATEVCDGADNDCDGDVDDADISLDLTTTRPFYWDGDKDTYGDADRSRKACKAPSGTVADARDCDDSNAAINPGALEKCDLIDNDCDGKVDDADDSLDSKSTKTWYRDADGDGFGDGFYSKKACSAPTGYTKLATDCDDGLNSVYPGAKEFCDGKKNDCNLKTWTAADENGKISLRKDDGTWTDMTSSMASGTAASPTTYPLTTNGTYHVCDGTYYLRVQDFKGIKATIRSRNGADKSTFDARNKLGFELAHALTELTIDGLTIRGGSNSSKTMYGAGIQARTGIVNVKNSVIAANVAYIGGGVGNNGAVMTFTDTEFSKNVATRKGSAIATSKGSTTTLVGCTIKDNTRGTFAIQSSGATTIRDSSSTGNNGFLDVGSSGDVTLDNTVADGSGESISAAGSLAFVNGTKIVNVGVSPSFCYAVSTSSTFRMTNSMISGNNCGGINASGAARVYLTNSLVAYNSSKAPGAGIWVDWSASVTCTATKTGSYGVIGNTTTEAGGAGVVTFYDVYKAKAGSFVSTKCDFGNDIKTNNTPSDIRTAGGASNFGNDESFTCSKSCYR